ncbi:MAG: hypothetical protein IT385_27370 [Deltaproteobacteria bacterium]|nr:hypothetical protein [Deltaproteobacteria bacterium]
MRPTVATLALVVMALGLHATDARALENPELVCEAPPDDTTELSPLRLLRAMSLDVRGGLPSLDELAAVEAAGEIPGDLVDALLDSDAFAERAVRHHRELLWLNLDNMQLVGVRARLTTSGNIWFRNGTQAIFYRGLNVRCLDEAARFDASGAVLTTAQPDGSRREGWVEVEPYWAPGTMIRVCAFDAQEAVVSPQGTLCASNEGLNDVACGCGPGLRHCAARAQELVVLRSLVEDVEHRIRDVVLEDASYLDLFLSSKAYINGPLAHYYRYQRAIPVINMDPSPVDLERLPDLSFDQRDTWVEVDLGDNHAGVLTSTAYLLRFQTNRARANQFYNSFLCQPFNAPSGGIPVSGPAHPDLQVRHGCEYCHAILEPAASHWGRWGERGATWLDPDGYPSFDAQCELCATTGFGCTDRCRRRYMIDMLEPAYEPFLGWLNPYVFLREEHEPFIEDGPRLLVRTTLADGRLPRCVARQVGERLLGRPFADDEEAVVDGLAATFVRSGYRYREVVKALLAEPSYRRVR